MDPVVQKALFDVLIPVTLTVVGASIVLWPAWRGRQMPRVAIWIAPLTTIGAILASFYGQEMYSAGRWLWAVPATLAPLLVWAAMLMFWPTDRRRFVLLAVMTGVIAAAIVGVLVWRTFYEDQGLWVRCLPVIAAALLGGCLYGPATGKNSGAAALAVGLGVAVLAPVVNFANFQSVAELLVPPAIIAGLLGVIALSVPRRRFAEVGQGFAAGAVGIALVMPAAASVAWSNGYDLPPRIAWALVLTTLAPLLVLIGQMPRVRTRGWVMVTVTVAAVLIPLAVALYLAMSWVDVEAYQAPF